MLENITPIILTYNEESNIARNLQALSWAEKVLIIDSYSNDETISICNQFSNVVVIQNPFESFAQQCNFALDQDIDTEWVLSMDADYICSVALIDEINGLRPSSNTQGYAISFQYLIDGKALRASLYPPRICLYRKEKGRYQQDGHAHKLKIDGEVLSLGEKMQHDDRKPFSRWRNSQEKYACQEAEKFRASSFGDLNMQDKCRRLGLGPLLVVPYVLIFKGAILDGSAGLHYLKQRFIAERILFARLFNIA